VLTNLVYNIFDTLPTTTFQLLVLFIAANKKGSFA